MVSTTCSNQTALSVAFWRLFVFFKLFELRKFLFKHVLCELLSHWPFGYSPFEAPTTATSFQHSAEHSVV